jgi:hypothetical protein
VAWLSQATGAAVPLPLHVAVSIFPDPEAAASLLDVDAATSQRALRVRVYTRLVRPDGVDLSPSQGGACSRVGPPRAAMVAAASGCGLPVGTQSEGPNQKKASKPDPRLGKQAMPSHWQTLGPARGKPPKPKPDLRKRLSPSRLET